VGFFDAVPYGHAYIRSFEWPWVATAIALMIVWARRRRLAVTGLRLAVAVLVAAAGYAWLGIRAGLPTSRVRRSPPWPSAAATPSSSRAPAAGRPWWIAGSSLQAERTAQLVTAPALWQLGVARLDAVILTHADADHIKDLPAVLERIPPTASL